jgi:hypothetical protein
MLLHLVKVRCNSHDYQVQCPSITDTRSDTSWANAHNLDN